MLSNRSQSLINCIVGEILELSHYALVEDTTLIMYIKATVFSVTELIYLLYQLYIKLMLSNDKLTRFRHSSMLTFRYYTIRMGRQPLELKKIVSLTQVYKGIKVTIS